MPKGVYTHTRKAVAERFWLKVNRDGPIPPHRPHLGSCWIWTASLKQSGYGQFQITRRGNIESAHRVSWTIHYGPIPDGLSVLHRCDNPPCVRPDHLFLGTQADNGLDMAEKKRSTFGQRNAQSKLTDEQVIAIRRKYAAGGCSHRGLAAEFGMAHQTIRNILIRKIWKHLD